MSFVRFGEDGSNVYVYDDVGGYVTCCFCALNPDADFHTTDLDAMLVHLTEHRAAGHHVPGWLDDELRDDWPYAPGVFVKEKT